MQSLPNKQKTFRFLTNLCLFIVRYAFYESRASEKRNSLGLIMGFTHKFKNVRISEVTLLSYIHKVVRESPYYYRRCVKSQKIFVGIGTLIKIKVYWIARPSPTELTIFCFQVRADGEETWISNNKYWETRKVQGFSDIQFEALWWTVFHNPKTQSIIRLCSFILLL